METDAEYLEFRLKKLNNTSVKLREASDMK